MMLALFCAGFLAFGFGFPAQALLLRCGLAACLRFSPRAAAALTSVCALCACLCAFISRGALRALPAQHARCAVPAAVLGGTLGRMLLLMFTARFSGSHALMRAQALPLLLLALLSLLPPRRLPFPKRPGALFALAFFCAAITGLCGAGGGAVLALFSSGSVIRNRHAPSALSLLVCLSAQVSAILLTFLAGAAQVFPPRMPLALALGGMLGALAAQSSGIRKKRYAASNELRTALKVYLVLAALACCEQAYA